MNKKKENQNKIKKKKKKNPLDDILEELEDYEEGCEPVDLMSSGE